MADVKISALPPATLVGNSDILPVVVGGVTDRVTKGIFLTGNIGEDIAITAAAGQNSGLYGNVGNSAMVITDDQFVTITGTTWITINVPGSTLTNEILIEDSVGINITVDAGLDFVIGSPSAVNFLKYNGAGNTLYLGIGCALYISYSPATPGDWAGTAPSDIKAAIDRLAACFTTNSLVKP
jgi:hypothetical protein